MNSDARNQNYHGSNCKQHWENQTMTNFSKHVAAWHQKSWIWSCSGQGRKALREVIVLHTTNAPGAIWHWNQHDFVAHILSHPLTLCQTSKMTHFIAHFNNDARIRWVSHSTGDRFHPAKPVQKSLKVSKCWRSCTLITPALKLQPHDYASWNPGPELIPTFCQLHRT